MLFLFKSNSLLFSIVLLIMAGLVCVRALKINRAAGTVVRHRLFTSTAPSSAGADPGPVIKNMSVADFNKILAGSERLKYQIIDVREKDELQAVALSGDDILNLPLSEASIWSQRVLDGELLDKQKPLLCLCKMGGRSMKAATFFVNEARFSEVHNIVGGIIELTKVADPSVVK